MTNLSEIARNFSEGLAQNRNRQFWVLQILGWSGWVILFTIRDYYWNHPFERVTLLLVDATAGLVLTTLLRYVYRAIWERPVIVRVIVVLAVSYAAAAVWQPIKNYAQYFYYNDFGAVAKFGWMAYFHGIIGYSYFLIIGWSGLYFGIKYYNLLQDEKEKSLRAESMAHEAQLRMLRYQLNPHFLFNTLNAISTLILEKDNETANQMVRKLGNFLRYSLDNDPMQKVSLAHEIDTMKLYLDIEQVRFDERLAIEFELEEEASKAMVPSMLLQPLVENSIKYAVAARVSGGKISISARVFAGDLLLEVRDDGPGIPLEPGKEPEFSGVGIANTRERLKELYGQAQSFRFKQALPHGLHIEIRIPFETGQK
ncbi:MAG: histidine kinase [Pseudomonadales bacterium]